MVEEGNRSSWSWREGGLGKAPEVRHEAVNVNVGSSGPHGYSEGKALRWGALMRWEQWLQQGQEEGGRAQVWQTGLGSLTAVLLKTSVQRPGGWRRQV